MTLLLWVQPLVLMVVLVMNGAFFVIAVWRRRWFTVAMMTVSTVGIAANIVLGINIAYHNGIIAGINIAAGCDENSPKEVPYREGMTVCPGQTVIMQMPAPASNERHL